VTGERVVAGIRRSDGLGAGGAGELRAAANHDRCQETCRKSRPSYLFSTFEGGCRMVVQGGAQGAAAEEFVSALKRAGFMRVPSRFSGGREFWPIQGPSRLHAWLGARGYGSTDRVGW